RTGEEHHRVDTLAVRVAEDTLRGKRIDAAIQAESLGGRAAGSRTEVLRIRAPLDHQRRTLFVEREANLVWKRLHHLRHERRPLDDMSISIDYAHGNLRKLQVESYQLKARTASGLTL